MPNDRYGTDGTGLGAGQVRVRYRYGTGTVRVRYMGTVGTVHGYGTWVRKPTVYPCIVPVPYPYRTRTQTRTNRPVYPSKLLSKNPSAPYTS